MSKAKTMRNHRRRLIRQRPPCFLCGRRIHYSLPIEDPLSFTLEHIRPRAMGGSNRKDNIAAAHRRCNQRIADQIEPLLRRARGLYNGKAPVMPAFPALLAHPLFSTADWSDWI